MSQTDLAPPSYESTIANTNTNHLQPQTQSERIHARLTNIRAQHINDTITTHILPLVHQRASAGLNRTSIALIPLLDATATSADEASKVVVDIVSGASEDDDGLAQVQLTHPVATLSFWSQESVLEELRAALVERLATSDDLAKGEGISKEAKFPLTTASPSSPSLPPPQSKSRRLFSRRTSSQQVQNRSLHAGTTGLGLDRQERVTVDVQRDEICLRTVSNFGLYETLTRPAFIVRIVIRG